MFQTDPDLENNGLSIYAVLRNTLKTLVEDRAVPSVGMATFGRDGEPVNYFGQTGSSLLIQLDVLDIESFLAFIPSAVNENSRSIPGTALMEVADRLKDEGEVNILLVQLSTTTDSVPDMSNYNDQHVSGVLYKSEAYNSWLENVATETGGEILIIYSCFVTECDLTSKFSYLTYIRKIFTYRIPF